MSLIATDITVIRRQKQILRGIDFRAHAGELTAIVGPNGSGKTTLLRTLTGEEHPTSGDIHLEGASVAETPPWRLAEMRGVLPQAATLAFPFNVAEVVRLGCPPGGDPALPSKALARVGLQGYETRFYQELSGGEQQRVQLARILAQVPEPIRDGQARWLFLDEPVSALDIGHQLQVMRLARTFADQGGGVVTVMHDLNLTAMFADRITLLQDGRVLGEGPCHAVLTDDLLSRAYECPVRVGITPPNGIFLLPQTAGA